MKIDYVIMEFPSSSETFASNDIKEVSKDNNVCVHSLKKSNEETKKLKKQRNINEIIMTYFTYESLLYIIKNPILIISTFFWILRYTYKKPVDFLKSILLLPRSIEIFEDIKKRKPDILHLFWGHYPSIVGYLVNSYCSDVKLSIFLGAYDLSKELPYSFVVAASADLIWTHSFYNKKKLINKYFLNSKKIRVAYRGVNLDKVKSEDLEIENNYIISAGRLVKSKNMISVVKTVERLNLKRKIKLNIFGKGTQQNFLKDYISKNNLQYKINLCGHIPQDELIDKMRRANIFVLMTNKKSEMLPNVIKEAMVSKCICVVSPSPGIEELIENGNTGFIIKNNDIDNAVNIIENILDHKYDLYKIRENAHKKIINDFNLNVEIKKYLKEWGKLLN